MEEIKNALTESCQEIPVDNQEKQNAPQPSQQTSMQPHHNAHIKFSPFVRNLIIASCILAFVLIGIWSYCAFQPDNSSKNHSYFEIQTISELTTIQCRFHNVAIRDVKEGFLGAKNEYIWFEFDGIVDIGIDMNKIQISEPNEEGIIRIYLPPAQILNATPDTTSIKKPVEKTGWFSEFDGGNEVEMILDATEDMKNDANTQVMLTAQAYERAQFVLEQYVINVGKMLGEDYTVEWVDADNIINLPATTDGE